jgi:hypothetical protein
MDFALTEDQEMLKKSGEPNPTFGSQFFGIFRRKTPR